MSAMPNPHVIEAGRAINLLVPGGGLVWLERYAAGLLWAACFGCFANVAILSSLVIPDDFPAAAPATSVGLAAIVYLASQLHYAQAVRDRRRASRRRRRDEALRSVCAALQQSDVAAAWAAVAEVRDLAEDDLLVAYRTAQVLSLKRDVRAAQAAWSHVRRLDRHHLYRREMHEAQTLLEGGVAGEQETESEAPRGG